MKIQLLNYTFDKTAKTVTFTDYTSIRLDSILLITNVTRNIIIYNFANPLAGGTVLGNILTLTYDTSLMDNTDKLQIFYDDGVSPTSETTQEEIRDYLFNLNEVAQNLRVLGVARDTLSNLRVSIQNAPAVSVSSGTITTVSNITNIGAYNATAIAQAQQNLTATIANINNIVI